MLKKLFACLTLLLVPIAASALPISYNYSGVASGSLNGEAFQGVAFSITGLGDTDNVGGWCCSTYQNTHSSATVSLAGFGTFDFLVATHTWMAPGCCMGFGADLGSNFLTLFDPDIVNVGYALDTAFAATLDFGASTQGQFNNVLTSGGGLTFLSVGPVTFQAITQAVSEPSLLLLLMGGLGTLAVVRRNRTSA